MSQHARSAVNKFSTLITVISIVTVGMLLTFQPMVYNNASAAPDGRAKVQKFRKNVLHLKLSPAVTQDAEGTFTGEPADQIEKLNNILAGAKRISAPKLKQGKAQSVLQAKLDTSLDKYYRVSFKEDVDMPLLTQQLKALKIVEVAYAEPVAAPSPSANYVSLQNYLTATPQGVDSNYASVFPGGSGDKVKIYDLEYSWNTNHEDLSKSRTALLANGTPVDPFSDNNHGTAVIGSMIADKNSYGVNGAVPNATLRLVNVNNAERGYDIVNAIYTASATAVAGDVVLIEQQTWGPTPEDYDFVPVEWTPAVYDAIKTLTTNGIIVIEAGGNGNQNLSDSTYYGSSFPMGKADSGAIIVGAGANCAGSARLSRLAFSNYGSRVNLQGPGDCVATTGYGNLSGGGTNNYYTNTFNGTSSAAPIVAASAVALSSSYKTLNGSTLSPAQIRSMLQQTGTAQNTVSGTINGNIGPMPNLAKVLLLSDKTSPSKPANLRASLNSSKKVVLTWSASADNHKVSSYKVYRDGRLYKTLTGTSLTDSSVSQNRTYKYYVVAVDPSNNVSVASSSISITVR